MAFETWNTLIQHNFHMLNPSMQSDLVNCDCIYIKTKENSVLHIVFLAVFLICLWLLKARMWMIFEMCNTLFSHNLDVLDLMLLSDLSSYDFMVLKWQERSVFHSVSFIFHRLKIYLRVISGSMDVIINMKQTVFNQFRYVVYVSVICFRLASMEVHQNKTTLCFP